MICGDKRRRRVLALSLREGELRAYLAERRGGSYAVTRSARADCAWRDGGEGPTLSEALAAITREWPETPKRCLVTLPADEVIALSFEMPPLEGEDEASFVEIQAERLLPIPLPEAAYALTRWQAPDGAAMATLFAARRERIAHIQAELTEAGLAPVAVSVAASAFCGDGGDGPAPLLLVGGGSALAVCASGRIAWVRSLTAGDTAEDRVALARELRLSLAALPEALKTEEVRVTVVGQDRTRVESVARLLGERGYSVDARAVEAEHGRDIEDIGCLRLCEDWLRGEGPALNLYAPEASRLARLVARASQRRFTTLATAAALLLILGGGGFWYQHHRLTALRKEWARLEPLAAEAEALQEELRARRSWFDGSPETLQALAALAQAFPEGGAVWVKSVRIAEDGGLTCTGSARDDDAWLAVLEALRATPAFADVQVAHMRGDNPMSFSVSCRWAPRGGG